VASDAWSILQGGSTILGIRGIVGVVALVTWVPLVSLRHCELSSCVGGLAKLLQTTPHLKSHERRQTWRKIFPLRQ
jgi:hypothetical protein